MNVAQVRGNRSLPTRLFVRVFGAYLLLALLSTSVELGLEYRSIRALVNDALVSLGRSVERSAAHALWTLDARRLQALAEDLARVSVVSRVAILDEQGRTLAAAGSGRPDSTGQVALGSLFRPQTVSAALSHESPRGTRAIGRLDLHADGSVSREWMAARLGVVLAGALLKALGMLAVFHLVIRWSLTRPLRRIAEQVADFRLSKGSPPTPAPDYPHADELGQLAAAVHTSQTRLAAAHEALEQARAELETRVAARERELARAHAQLTAAEVERSRLDERDRLLREMHDGFGSQLAGARLMAQHGDMGPQRMAEVLDDCLADLHLLADTLGGNAATLADALADWRFRMERRLDGLPVVMDWRVDLEACPELPQRVVLQVLRVVQEAVTNALRHGRPRTVRLAAHAGADGTMTLSVEDDGVGLPDPPRAGRGTLNMRARAREIGATVMVEPALPGPGTRVRLSLPAPAAGRVAGARG